LNIALGIGILKSWIPACAGMTGLLLLLLWIPAYAGMTGLLLLLLWIPAEPPHRPTSCAARTPDAGMTRGAACQPVLKHSRKHPAHPPHKPKIIRENSC